MINFERRLFYFMAKRYRRYVVGKNKQYETHQLDSEGQLVKVSNISDNDSKEKVKTETFSIWQENMEV